MKLTRLDLNCFRAARGLSLDLNAPRIAVFGLNGAGKTSVREAVRWALRGVCEGTDRKGAGAEVLIPTGAKEASVALDIAGIGKVTRTFAEHGGTAFSVEGFTGASQTQQQALLGKLNTTDAMLDAVLETEYFSRLHHADGKALILALLNVRVSVDDRDLTLDELDVKYKQAFEERKDAKRRLSTNPSPKPPVAPEHVQIAQRGCGVERCADAVRARLTALRGELDAVQRQIGETVGQRRALLAEQTRLRGEITAGVPNDDQAEQKILALRGQIEKVAPDVAPGDPQRLTFLRNRLAALEQHQPAGGCVLDTGIPCKTPKKAFTEKAADVRAELEAQPTEQLPASGRMEVQRLERQIAELEFRKQAADRARATIAAAHLRLETLAKELEALPDTSAQEADVLKRNETITRGEGVLAAAVTFEQNLDRYAEEVKARAELEAKVAALETRVEMLGPSGLRVPALADAMGRFESAINKHLERWGWQVHVQAEPWQVFANGRPFETYSRSERFRMGVGLQFAIAELSGLSFAIVDELDMLDIPNRRLLAGMVMAAPLEQIVVLSTREEEAALSTQEGWIQYRLRQEDGRSVVVESTAVMQGVA